MSAKVITTAHADKCCPEQLLPPQCTSSFFGFPLWRKQNENVDASDPVDAELVHLAQAFPSVSFEVVADTLEKHKGNYLSCAKALLELTRARDGSDFHVQEIPRHEVKGNFDEWELIDKGIDREDKDDWELVSDRIASRTPPPREAPNSSNILKVLEECMDYNNSSPPNERSFDGDGVGKAACDTSASLPVITAAPAVEPRMCAAEVLAERAALSDQKENLAGL